MSKRAPTGCYISWRPWESQGWSKAHETYVDDFGQLTPLCGAVQPADSEDGDHRQASGFCQRCAALAKANGGQE